jgi:hypothetical protein
MPIAARPVARHRPAARSRTSGLVADHAGDVALTLPGESSARTMSPGPTCATVPSPTSISAVPESEIEYCRRGAQGGAGAVDEGKEGGTSKALKSSACF